jgi:hypothetical protein
MARSGRAGKGLDAIRRARADGAQKHPCKDRLFAYYPALTSLGGRSSGVEHNLAKVGVEGSNPFARSKDRDFESRRKLRLFVFLASSRKRLFLLTCFSRDFR